MAVMELEAATPIAPPASASRRLSDINCRIRRLRDAPRLSRVASSRLREVARASISAATLAHAMSSTIPAMPISNHSDDDELLRKEPRPRDAGLTRTDGM